MMRRALLATLALSSLAVSPAVHAHSGQSSDQCISMPRAISEALAFDPRVTGAQADRDAARAGILAANSRNLPQLSLFGRAGPSDNPQLNSGDEDQFGLQVQQEIYSFGARKFAQQAARSQAQAARFGLSEAENNVGQGAALAYIEYQRAEAILRLAREEETAFAQDAQSSQSRLERNIITLTDASQIRARYAVARSERINAEVAFETAHSRLAVLTNHPIACTDTASTEAFVGQYAARLLSMDPRAAVDEALSRSVAVRRARSLTDAAQASANEASRNNLPVINSFAIQFEEYESDRRDAFGQKVDDFVDETRVGITLNQSLFAGGRNRAQRLDAKARVKGARADEGLQRLIIEDLVLRSLAQAKAQQRAGLELLEASGQARIQLDNTVREYERGTKTLTDLVLANEAYFRAARQETEARFAFYASLVRVYGAMGFLTDQVDR